MSKTNRRFYWIQLAQGFFKSKEMKLLRKMPGGDTYTIIYLKLMLISLEDDGYLFYDGLAKDLAEELSLLIDEDVEAIRMTLIFLENKGLMTKKEDSSFFLEQVPEMVGSETASTRRSRKSRENNQKVLHCNNDATNGNGEIEIELKKDKELEIELYQDTKKEERFIDIVEANIGRGLVKFEYDMINEYLINQKVSKELFLEAVKIAVGNNVRKFNYIARILDNWINDGIKTPEQAYQAQRDFKAKKSKQTQQQESNVPEWSKVNDPDYVIEQLSKEEQERAKQQVIDRLNKLKKE